MKNIVLLTLSLLIVTVVSGQKCKFGKLPWNFGYHHIKEKKVATKPIKIYQNTTSSIPEFGRLYFTSFGNKKYLGITQGSPATENFVMKLVNFDSTTNITIDLPSKEQIVLIPSIDKEPRNQYLTYYYCLYPITEEQLEIIAKEGMYRVTITARDDNGNEINLSNEKVMEKSYDKVKEAANCILNL